MRKLPAEILDAKASASTYLVKPAPYGFNIWRFRDWNSSYPGWQIETNVSSREAARYEILHRLGIDEPTDRPTIRMMDEVYAEYGPF